MRSDDSGRTWQRGAVLDAADLDVDPADPALVLATTERGLLQSTDGGTTFTLAAAQPPRPLLLIDHAGDLLAGVDAAGGVWVRSDDTWVQAGALPGAPAAFTAVDATRYLAATAEAVLSTRDGGRNWSPIASTSG